MHVVGWSACTQDRELQLGFAVAMTKEWGVEERVQSVRTSKLTSPAANHITCGNYCVVPGASETPGHVLSLPCLASS